MLEQDDHGMNLKKRIERDKRGRGEQGRIRIRNESQKENWKISIYLTLLWWESSNLKKRIESHLLLSTVLAGLF